MTFKFSWLCELFNELETQKYQQRATYSRQDNPDHRIVTAWYSRYNDNIRRSGPSAVAFLSALLPERRPDRTYDLQEKRLSHIFARALGLGATRCRELCFWQNRDGPDFASCVMNVMAQSECAIAGADQQVTLEEIDEALNLIAANAVSSSPAIKAKVNDKTAFDLLNPIICRLQSIEAKWLVRMIQKSYRPVEIPEYAALHSFHFFFPRLLEVQDSVEAAVQILERPEIAGLPARPSREYEIALMPIMVKSIDPKLGVMIRRQPFHKARSIKHCVKMTESRVMSVERKYDGEYCQIHIDRSIGPGCKSIQIFSKSGRDSTLDRLALHDAIRAGLKLDKPDCKIKERAILEGELVIYSDRQRDVLPFYHVRKHVRHGGRRIGTERDSPKKSHEYPMIVFFDILMLDSQVLMNAPHSSRRAHLKGLITKIEGTAQLAERSLIDFSHTRAAQILRDVFGTAIRKRWEGFVLKGLDDPYFSWKQSTTGIKLKKDYIAGLGDTADLCIIGGRRDARDEFAFGVGQLSWTKFYIACVLNKDNIRRFDERPAFRIVDRLGLGSLSKDDMLLLNSEGKLYEHKFEHALKYMTIKHPRKDIGLPTELFTHPMVVEIMGAGYERPQTVDFYVLRFPRRVGAKIKLHRDRGVADTTSFDEMQEMAGRSLKGDKENASQEDAAWIERLEAANPKLQYIVDVSQSVSPYRTPHSATTVSLTPGTAKRASTQQSPVLVRIDSDDLASVEFYQRYPDSAPAQTPSRHSESTVSPTTCTKPTTLKRPMPLLSGSPIVAHNRKRKRVKFGARLETFDSVAGRAFADITDSAMNQRTNSTPDTSFRDADATSTGNPVVTERQVHAYPKPLSSHTTDLENLLPTPLLTAEAPENPAQVQAQAPQIAYQAPASSPPLSSPCPQSHQTPPYLIAARPIYVPPSLSNNHHLKPFLQHLNSDFSQSATTFVDSLQVTSSQHKHIILIDSSCPSESTADIQSLAQAFDTNLLTLLTGRSNILLFDYHVLGTNFAKSGFTAPIGSVVALGECKQYFQGVMEFCERIDVESGRVRRALRPTWDSSLEEALYMR